MHWSSWHHRLSRAFRFIRERRETALFEFTTRDSVGLEIKNVVNDDAKNQPVPVNIVPGKHGFCSRAARRLVQFQEIIHESLRSAHTLSR